MSGLSRRSFLKASAVGAAGAATIASPVAAAAHATSEAPVVVHDPTGALPHEPIVAVIRDAARGEVTIMRGTHETTYRDRALVKRLVRAAR
jgi:hypothetical protein